VNGSASSQQRIPQSPKPPPLKRPKDYRPTKAERTAARTIVLAARAKGHSIEESARIAGISYATASKYLQQAKESGEDLSRERLLNLLSTRIDSQDTPIQYVTPMASLYAELQGYKDRDKRKMELKSVAALFNAWNRETTNAIESASAEAIAPKPLGE